MNCAFYERNPCDFCSIGLYIGSNPKFGDFFLGSLVETQENCEYSSTDLPLLLQLTEQKILAFASYLLWRHSYQSIAFNILSNKGYTGSYIFKVTSTSTPEYIARKVNPETSKLDDWSNDILSVD